MFSEGIYPIGDGLLDIDEKRLKGLLVQDDINDFYDVEQAPFARGKFAAVRRAIHKKSGVHFAAKFLKRRRRAQSSDKEIKHEIAVLMLCSGSDNIVKLNAVHESRSDTALLLELATGGELQAVLDNEGSLTEAHTRICMREVLKALQFLHKRSIAHLDLKPQNILLNDETVEHGLKLCDFGISRVVESGSKVREILGTPDYVAPEVLQYEPLSLKTDIWSLGVLAYVLLSGFSPFGGDSKQETFLNISQCTLSFPDELFEGVSDLALDFIKSTLRIKPTDRLTALECLDHIWLKDECTINRKFLNISSASDGVSDDQYDDDDILDEDDDEDDAAEEEEENVEHHNRSNSNNSSSIIKLNGCSKQNGDLKSTPATDLSRLNSSSSISNSNDYDKENFLTKTANKSTLISSMQIVNTSKASPQNNSSSCSSNTCTSTVSICLFPDAPTTPKVIRKAPSSDSSPTSVKALVKKFQLESGEPLASPSLLLKEAQNNHQQQSPMLHHHHNHHHHHHHKNANDKFNNSSSLLISNNSRKNSTDGSSSCNATISSPSTTTANGGTSSPTATSPSSYKTSCVFCLSCGGPGCRHSGSSVACKTTTNNLGLDQGIIC